LFIGLEDNDKDHGVRDHCVSINKNTIDRLGSLFKVGSTELSSFSFWSKYYLLMDRFPSTNKIVMQNQKGLKKLNCSFNERFKFFCQVIQLFKNKLT